MATDKDVRAPTMNKTTKQLLSMDLNHQGANALLAATFEFLRRNRISADSIIDFTQKYHIRHRRARSLRLYRSLVRTYDDMGVIMATWFSDPRFLNGSGYPRPLSQGTGPLSISHLIRVSGASIKPTVALELMRQSPSIRFDEKGTISAHRRVFVLPKFEVPRAAFVVERFLDTLQRNVLNRKTKSPLLLERTCYVSQVDLGAIAPILRDIDCRGYCLYGLCRWRHRGPTSKTGKAKVGRRTGCTCVCVDKASRPNQGAHAN